MADNNILKDPEHARSRIFIGNIPTCTKEELTSICIPYGKTVASMVKEKFGFVQFSNEIEANKAAQALNGSVFKGKKITVRNAALKPPPKKNQQDQQQQQQQQQQQHPHPEDNFVALQEYYHSTMPMNYFDCEIVVLDKDKLTNYAEFIELRLKRCYLTVDLIFPRSEVPIGKVLANISSRGVFYAVVVNEQNQELQSITVHILYGQPAEHRNMPVEDAINLISGDFRIKLTDEVKIKKAISTHHNQHNAISITTLPIKERHPDAIKTLLNLLADNTPLTILQYDKIIKYLQDKRELQLKAETGNSLDNNMNNNEPDPEIELQKKILSILNKPSIAEKHTNLLYPVTESLLKDYTTIELLKDESIQKALNSLMITSLVNTIEANYKF